MLNDVKYELYYTHPCQIQTLIILLLLSLLWKKEKENWIELLKKKKKKAVPIQRKHKRRMN